MPIRLPRLLRKPAARPPLVPATIDLASGTLPVVLRTNPRARRLILRLQPAGAGVVVTVPKGANAGTISDFLERHRGWIEARVGHARARVVRVVPGAVIPFRGETLTLVGDAAPRTLHLEAGESGFRLLVGGEPARFSRRVADFLKREARRELQACVDRHAAAVGLKPLSLTLKDTRSRWGSCTTDRRLSFSWRIAMAPPGVLDYLAAHEVAHFREMNHGPGFWSLCRTLCPAMDEGRDWLKRHGATLHGVDFGAAAPEPVDRGHAPQRNRTDGPAML